METRHDIARKYGYHLRSSLDADFLSERRADGSRSDDLMKITTNEISVYAHDANAYFVASLVRATPR